LLPCPLRKKYFTITFCSIQSIEIFITYLHESVKCWSERSLTPDSMDRFSSWTHMIDSEIDLVSKIWFGYWQFSFLIKIVRWSMTFSPPRTSTCSMRLRCESETAALGEWRLRQNKGNVLWLPWLAEAWREHHCAAALRYEMAIMKSFHRRGFDTVASISLISICASYRTALDFTHQEEQRLWKIVNRVRLTWGTTAKKIQIEPKSEFKFKFSRRWRKRNYARHTRASGTVVASDCTVFRLSIQMRSHKQLLLRWPTAKIHTLRQRWFLVFRWWFAPNEDSLFESHMMM
jgi:hypothetical protein